MCSNYSTLGVIHTEIELGMNVWRDESGPSTQLSELHILTSMLVGTQICCLSNGLLPFCVPSEGLLSWPVSWSSNPNSLTSSGYPSRGEHGGLQGIWITAGTVSGSRGLGTLNFSDGNLENEQLLASRHILDSVFEARMLGSYLEVLVGFRSFLWTELVCLLKEPWEYNPFLNVLLLLSPVIFSWQCWCLALVTIDVLKFSIVSRGLLL